MARRPTDAPADMEGQALVTEAEIQTDDPAEGTDVVDIVTIAPGTFSDLGLVPVGTKQSVKVEAYSDEWMRVRNLRSAKLVEDELIRRRAKRA